ncbi:hypothetical protein GCM10009718_25100 [Isoptericola halotolerans]|uniref:Uncharacterized protein n=1 Tax=Isoptericola halotolerans TaxID=300560 RepID=A0ABX2A7N9_9MICO|nr:SHOCT domain-containing protein [Isoptericola halotolerans]NOV97925.1 hypothetical protein [Isoptericola halotolerans]
MPRRRGRPGLVGTMARTAVNTGTASATSRALDNRADARADQHAGAQAYDTLTRLQSSGEMRSAGPLPDAELAAAKATILG